jgi:thiamine biosynthesis protein ThiI
VIVDKVILIRYGEIFLKGKNFSYFEKKLIDNIENKISKFDCTLVKMNKRFFVEGYQDRDEKKIIEGLKQVFGIYSISRAVKLEGDKGVIDEYISGLKFKEKTFRVSVNRADKTFPISSIEYSKYLGGVVLKNNNHLSVDLHNPQINLCVDIRENHTAFVYYENIMCRGGMPVGTGGKGMLLLSGGIDSPVAGYMMSKRGMSLSAIHFHSYPYTSESAKQKVIDLANIIKKYSGNFKLYIVSFTEIQEAIHKNCDGDFMITIMRRIMYRIAERIAKSCGAQCVITGENLGQVASQTVESMTVTNAVVQDLPIFRPLISFDKEDITSIAKDIGTFETSILPYEDCCTVFLPKHPVIKPKIEKCLVEESNLDLESLINNALNSVEIIDIE